MKPRDAGRRRQAGRAEADQRGRVFAACVRWKDDCAGASVEPVFACRRRSSLAAVGGGVHAVRSISRRNGGSAFSMPLP